MKRARLRNNSFRRIGNRYAPYFDHDHFMGHSGVEDLTKSKVLLNYKEVTHKADLTVYSKEK